MDLHSSSVSTRWVSALLLPAALVALAPALSAQSDEDDTYMGENPERYASVRILDGEATIRKGEVEEALSRGIPIAEGDVVESHGRGVLQLADGTRVAFGGDTRFEVATLFTDKDQDRQVLLRLDYGRLRIAMGRESEAQIRIDMPSGSAILTDGSSASFEVERDRTARVKVISGRLVFRNERDKATLMAGERLTVYSDQDRLDRIQNFNTYSSDSFEAWSDRNLSVRRGPSWDKVPPEIRYYSDDLDNNGDWVYVEEYRTWCWRPLRVSAEWRPYWQGRWGAYPGGMTWISDEPWGYVTYHHGRWGWGGGLGWYWIPGVYYSPAWVAWQTSDTYLGWAPMGYRNHPATWGYGAWGGGYSWNVVDINFIHVERIHTRTYRDPRVIRSFNSGRESTGWNPGSSGNRSIAPPWRQSPLVVSQNEFRHPAQMQRVLQDPNASRNRLHTYEQQSGRTIYRRPLSEVRTVPGSAGTPSAQPPSGSVPFEDRNRLRTQPVRPILRSETPASTMESPGPNRPLARPQGSPPPRQGGTPHQGSPGSNRPNPQEQPIQPRGTAGPGAGQVSPNAPRLPPSPHNRMNPGPGRNVPREQPIYPRSLSGPGAGPSTSAPPPSPPSNTRMNSGPSRNVPREQPVQPRQTQPSGEDQTRGNPPPPPPLIKKYRPLGRP